MLSLQVQQCWGSSCIVDQVPSWLSHCWIYQCASKETLKGHMKNCESWKQYCNMNTVASWAIISFHKLCILSCMWWDPPGSYSYVTKAGEEPGNVAVVCYKSQTKSAKCCDSMTADHNAYNGSVQNGGELWLQLCLDLQHTGFITLFILLMYVALH